MRINRGADYPLRYTREGMIYMDSQDDCDAVVDAMLATGYSEEFCVALDWDPAFIARLMGAGFLVMSENLLNGDILLPKLHLVRSALFFPDLHIKKSVKPFLSRYELRFDTDFEAIVHKCLAVHGDSWLTSSLVKVIFTLREQNRGPETAMAKASLGSSPPRPVSFGLYRNGELKAGEFGIIRGRVYTSYSGYKEENNAGTVQIILMTKWLEKEGFDFLDFGMPLDYKTDLGAKNIPPGEFVRLWRKGQRPGLSNQSIYPEHRNQTG
jgi:Leu/Phe-tRNA-protein transferase